MAVCTGVALWGTGAACVPVPLELDEPDAAPNSPPMLVSVTNEVGGDLPSFQTVTIRRNDSAQKMIVVVSDNDSADAVFVNFYVDYNVSTPTPRVGGCQATPSVSGSERAPVDCFTAPICAQILDSNIHFLEAIVTDRALDDSDPSFRGLVGDGLFTIGRWWQMTCQ